MCPTPTQVRRFYTGKDDVRPRLDTFEKYFRGFPKFFEGILSWSPDYLVPVAKKGAKLLKASVHAGGIDGDRLKYRQYFELTHPDLRGMKVAVFDDATQYTSTLSEYRHYFERLGAVVRTFSFVGHEQLFQGKREMYDELAEISVFLPEPVYQEYLLQQSYYLLDHVSQYDLDHLVFETQAPPETFQRLLSELSTKGKLLHIEDYFLRSGTRRFTLDDLMFFDRLPFLSDDSVSLGPLRKIKLVYNPGKERLLFSPLVFPTWSFGKRRFDNSLLMDVPFELPFALPRWTESSDRQAMLRAYYDIWFACVGGLARAFVQELDHFPEVKEGLRIRRGDLDAVFGVTEAARLESGVRGFVRQQGLFDFTSPPRSEAQALGRSRFKDFAEVLDHLKLGYERGARSRRSRVGYHYFLPYESLFKRFEDPTSLSENLDYYCDLGVIVPETIRRGGQILRACRTGEPDGDYNWKRTQVLIPLAIDRYLAQWKPRQSSVGPMALNKLLANFVYDYPSEMFHDLHSLIGEPYTYGTLVKVYHHHRAPSKPDIYQAHLISPYYRWDKRTNTFFILDPKGMRKDLGLVFDEHQEVPYSEVVTYFTLMSRIAASFRSLDVLNMLSICRDSNYLYSHIIYNVRTCLAAYGNFLDLRYTNHPRARESLKEARKHADSAATKIQLAKECRSTMNVVRERFGGKVEFLKAVERLQRNYSPPGSAMSRTLADLERLIKLERLGVYLGLLDDSHLPECEEELSKMDPSGVLHDFGIDAPADLTTMTSAYGAAGGLWAAIYTGICSGIDGLPAEEPLLSSRLKMDLLQRATNIATNYVYKNKLDRIALLYMDFSGLRSIPEPKEEVISRYYKLVEKNVRDRSGVKLYGGRDGDDAYTILFIDVRHALECVKDIKKGFSQELFLSTHGDIKFGLCYVPLPIERKEEDIVRCWGTAKDCCEYKSGTFRNRGDLLVSEEALDNIRHGVGIAAAANFVPIPGESLKEPPGLQLYRFADIQPS